LGSEPLPGQYAQHDDEPDDGAEDVVSQPPLVEPPAKAAPHPLDGWTPARIETALRDAPESLGSISLGRPSAGALFNPVQMPTGDGWSLIDPADAWGTQETVDFIIRAIQAVRARYPDSHPVYIGHISSKKGGSLRPHISHQAGRDVDLSFYYTDDSARWYRRATGANLDLPRTWALIRAFITETDVELILVDHSLQKLLREHALSIGEDPDWIASLFQGVPGKLRPLIVHAKGHATHLHVRFFNPIAQETARRAHSALVKSGRLGAPTAFTLHKVKKGETLGMLARKYGTSVRDIQRANGLKGTLIREKQTYRVPRKGKLAWPLPVRVPPRRLPPSSPSTSAASARN